MHLKQVRLFRFWSMWPAASYSGVFFSRGGSGLASVSFCFLFLTDGDSRMGERFDFAESSSFLLSVLRRERLLALSVLDLLLGILRGISVEASFFGAFDSGLSRELFRWDPVLLGVFGPALLLPFREEGESGPGLTFLFSGMVRGVDGEEGHWRNQ